MSEKLSIVAIGGGAPHTTSRSLIEASLDLTGKQRPNILCLLTAKYTQNAYDKSLNSMQSTYRDELGLKVEALHKFGTMPSPTEVQEKIDEAAVLYVGGGDTKYMMEQWKQNDVDSILRNAVLLGKVVTGISAGMLAWFKAGHSDSESYVKLPFQRTPCLDF